MYILVLVNVCAYYPVRMRRVERVHTSLEDGHTTMYMNISISHHKGGRKRGRQKEREAGREGGGEAGREGGRKRGKIGRASCRERV